MTIKTVYGPYPDPKCAKMMARNLQEELVCILVGSRYATCLIGVGSILCDPQCHASFGSYGNDHPWLDWSTSTLKEPGGLAPCSKDSASKASDLKLWVQVPNIEAPWSQMQLRV